MRRTYQQAYHDSHLIEQPVRATVWRVISEFLAPYISPQNHVLELGAGYCYWINNIRAAHKVAIDLWERMIEFAGPDVEVIQHDLAEGLSCLGERQFDVVLASNLLEHFAPDEVLDLVGEVYDRLRASGRFIIIQPNYYYAYRHYFDDYTHRSVFSHVSLANLLRAQRFDIEKVMPRFMPYSMRSVSLPVPSWLIRLYLHSPIKPFAGQMLVVARRKAS